MNVPRLFPLVSTAKDAELRGCQWHMWCATGDEALQTILAQYDTDGDGTISFSEFCVLMIGYAQDKQRTNSAPPHRQRSISAMVRRQLASICASVAVACMLSVWLLVVWHQTADTRPHGMIPLASPVKVDDLMCILLTRPHARCQACCAIPIYYPL